MESLLEYLIQILLIATPFCTWWMVLSKLFKILESEMQLQFKVGNFCADLYGLFCCSQASLLLEYLIQILLIATPFCTWWMVLSKLFKILESEMQLQFKVGNFCADLYGLFCCSQASLLLEYLIQTLLIATPFCTWWMVLSKLFKILESEMQLQFKVGNLCRFIWLVLLQSSISSGRVELPTSWAQANPAGWCYGDRCTYESGWNRTKWILTLFVIYTI